MSGTRRPTDPGPMETANGTIRLGDHARVIGGPGRGQRGTVTHLYRSGVFAGLVVIDDRCVVEGVNVESIPATQREEGQS